MELASIVAELARGLAAADALRPVAKSHRGTRVYQPGIGPHAENAAIALALATFTSQAAIGPWGQFVPYPGFPRQKCDLWVGQPCEWVIEIKMARFRGDNGKPDDTAIKDILSPYESDRSALADCTKLATAQFTCRKAITIYGFDYPDRPLDPVIDAFELLAARQVQLSSREVAVFSPLMHPVHSAGRVFGWEVKTPRVPVTLGV
jgi:hypothetical protein